MGVQSTQISRKYLSNFFILHALIHEKRTCIISLQYNWMKINRDMREGCLQYMKSSFRTKDWCTLALIIDLTIEKVSNFLNSRLAKYHSVLTVYP